MTLLSSSWTVTPFGVGRRPESDLELAQGDVSGRHAEFRYESDGWIVVDHQSRNGTFVNGQRIADRSPVRIGDVIHFATRGYEVVPGAAGSGERMDPTVHTESISDVQGLVDLLHVIKDQRTFPHFQPVVDL